MPANPSTIGGITFSQAKRIAKAEFEDGLIQIEQNIKHLTYDVYVNETALDKRQINKFKKHWSDCFRIIPIEVKKPM